MLNDNKLVTIFSCQNIIKCYTVKITFVAVFNYYKYVFIKKILTFNFFFVDF